MPKSSKNKINKQLIVITGPTAIGKTGLAVFLANQFSTEIISFDSRQFFQQMKIGTAVPTEEELKSIPHHFIQHLDITDTYSVGDFEKDAMEKIGDLFKIHDTIIMVGGSGLYEKAVTQGLDSFPKIDSEIREKLNQEFEKFGLENLQNELQEVDPEFYKNSDIKNPKRVIRALEIFRGTGKTLSSFQTQNKIPREFNILKIGLELPRAEIYDRINRRVDLMIKNGLLDEARKLYPNRNLNSLQTVGYRELFEYFDGTLTLEEAIEKIKRNTRRYAKRQLTWYRKDENLKWFSPENKEEILHCVNAFIENPY